MKRSKRILALFLSMVLLLGMLPMSALAAENEGEEELKRYTVLVLDTSSTATFLHDGEPIYTADTAIEYVKKAAMKFISSLVNADGTNYVAVVSFKATASVVSGFTDDTQALNKKVGELTAADNIRDISAGLEAADALISTVPDGEHVRKNVVLFTTGMTNNGDYSYSGRYDENTVGSNWRRTDTNIRLYAYANHAISVAEALKQKATLYTIGLFQTMEGMPEQGKDIVEFFKLTAKDLATSTDYYYPVDDPDDLEFTFGDVAGDIVNEKKIITSKFKWSGEAKKGGDQESICYYSDDYFMESSTIMNSHLRTMSIAFVLSSFASEDSDTTWEQKSNSEKDEEAKKTEDIVFSKTAKWRNARDLLCGKENDKDYPGLGFGDETFRVNDFWMSKPTRDSIGVLAANKTLRDGSTLVALAIRGGGYEQEWSSNLTVGLWDEHEGFAKAKRDTLDFLDEYLTEMKITGPIKLWIVGYSRSAVTANMVGGALDSGYQLANGTTVAFDDLFVYTFEPPQGSMKSTTRGNYSNIHNIINGNDLVAMVAPSAWDFARFNSNNDWIPSAAGTRDFIKYRKNMLRMLEAIDGMQPTPAFDYKIREFLPLSRVKVDWKAILPGGEPFISREFYNVSTHTALCAVIDYLADDVLESRATYVADWQAGMRTFMYLWKGGSIVNILGVRMSPIEFTKDIFSKLTFERIMEILAPAYKFSLDPRYTLDKREKEIRENIRAFVAEALSNYNLIGTAEWLIGLEEALNDLLWRLMWSSAKDALLNNGTKVQLLADFIYLIVEDSVFQPHYPDITFAWMMSMDSYYNGEDVTKSNQVTRVVHINCPVDISVYDGRGTLVASIVGDEPQVIDGSAIPAFVNTDGEKVVMLPPDETYEIRVEATAEGSVNLGIQEYYFSTASVNRLQNYYNIPVQTGELIKVRLPELTEQERTSVCSDGSDAQYQVLHGETTLTPSESYTGEDAQRSYEITVTVDGENGIVKGGGTFAHGTFAQLEAFPRNGAEFLGWYLDENLVSTDAVYRFAVTEDMAFTARFGDAAELYTLHVSAESGGTVKNVTLTVPAGVQINLVAVADPEYTFAFWKSNAGTIENTRNADTWFTMPSEDAQVFATFTKNGEPDEPEDPETPTPVIQPSGPSSQPKHEENCPGRRFQDVDTTLWYHAAIDFVLEQNYMSGTSQTTFAPNGALTRAMLVQILYNMEQKPVSNGSVSFKDVKAGDWYKAALTWAIENQIVMGYTDGTFRPNDAISREQLAAILFRYHAYKGREADQGNDLGMFSDAKRVSAWATDAMQWAVAKQIVNGKGNGLLDPHGATTRAQAAQMLMNYQKSLG